MTPDDRRKLLSGLTERQRDVLELFCKGLSYKQIGEELFITESTVKGHMSTIRSELRVDSSTELAKAYCALLSEGTPPPAPVEAPEEPEPEPEEPEPKPEPVMGGEDLFLEESPPPKRSGLPMLLVGAVGGMCLAVVVTVGIIYVLGDRLGIGVPGPAQAPKVETREVTREVTAPAVAAEVSPTPLVHTREVPVTREVEVTVMTAATPQDTATPSEPTATLTPEPTDTAPPPMPTDTPVGMVNEVYEVEGEQTASWRPHETGLYVQAGDRVDISYLQGEWWIGQELNNDWVSQTPTAAEGYVGREGERVSSLLGVDNPDQCRLLTSAPFGSLIGRIGEDGAWFLVGEHEDFTAQVSGILYLSMNYLTNNRVTNCPYGAGGAIRVRVVVTPP